MTITFAEVAWEQYQEWAGIDRGIKKRIKELIKQNSRDPSKASGKPEPGQGDLKGFRAGPSTMNTGSHNDTQGQPGDFL